MNKRDFLKASGAILTGSMLSHLDAGEPPRGGPRRNWAGNYTYQAKSLQVPKNLAEVRTAVRNASNLKALGARHSFNGIADSPEEQISLKNLNEMVLDPKTQTVSVGAGVTYGHLAPYLQEHGYAVHNLASLPHVSVAGACATGTHGSGNKNGNLSTAVSGLELVTASGELTTLTRERDTEWFQGAVVGLGALGVVTKTTLDLVPTFLVSQVVYENLSLAVLEEHLEDVFSSGYSVSLFTDWQNHRATQVWIKRKVASSAMPHLDPEFYGAKLATRNLHPLAGHSAENCTEQMGVPGPWHERLPHFKMNFTPSSGAELQSEYFVPRQRAYEAILAVEKLREHITPHLFITELRTIDGDNLWMSQCYQRPALAIHFTWKPEWPAVKQVLPLIEQQLAPFNARPHWAKLFTMAPARVQVMYDKLADFEELAKHYDPHGKFRNEFLNTEIYGT